MGCPEENVIVDFARGELAKDARAAVEAHIDACGACAQLVAEMARIFADEPDDPSDAEPRARPPPPNSRVSQATLATEGAFSPSSATHGNWKKSPEPLLPQGAKLGRYVVIDRVGAGGMGVVYAAYDPELDRKVALKVLRSSAKGGRNDQRARLIREAQAMAKLSHPNVITVHDVGTVQEQVFIAMEFIDGGTLGQWLTQARSWREILRVFRLAGEGLESAHEVGLVHRDFKPDNVLMGTDGRVLVTDFGLARPAAGNTGRFSSTDSASGQAMLHASLTQTGALVGTPAYMAPEQLHGRSTTALTDQFSFCVALYEALYGERPFPGQSLVELVHHVTEGNIRPAPKEAKVPRWLRRAVQRGLHVEPHDRYPSMRPLLVALRRDPWRQWRRWGSVTIPTAVIGIGIVAYQQVERRDESACARTPEMLAGIWDEATKAKIQRAFTATSRPYAADVFESTRATLDEYARVWVDMRGAACRDEAGAEQPTAVLALRTACLQRRLGGLEALADVLVTADSETVAAAQDAARGLPDLAICSDLESLTERAELVDSPEIQDAAAYIDQLSVRASVLTTAAGSQEAHKLAEQMIEYSQAAGYRRGEAEGLYLLGRTLRSSGNRSEAETAFHHALSASLAAGHAEIMARSSVGLVWISADEARPLDEAERWAAHGLAALAQTAGGRPRIEAELYHALGVARGVAGQFEPAQAALERGLAALQRVQTGQDELRAAFLGAEAELLVSRERYDEALAKVGEASKAIELAYGDRHPNSATARDERRAVLARMGLRHEALAMAQQALEIRRNAFGEVHVTVGRSHQNIATVLAQMGDLQGALKHALLAVDVMAQASGDASLECLGAKAELARVQMQMRRHDAAVTTLAPALEASVASWGDAHPQTLALRVALAQVQLERGQADLALALAEKVVAIEALAGEGDKLATARFVLARALVNASVPDAARARSLAELARQHFLAGDVAQAERIAAWLAEHPA